MRALLSFTFTFLLISGLSGCSDSSPSSSSMVQYLITNNSNSKINRLTILLEEQNAGTSKLVDSVFITNIPENLPIRLTYDINKNSATGSYRLIARGNTKVWNNTFGNFTGKTDSDSDHIYNLEILDDSVIVIP
jgi:hypothetical protein